MNERLRKALYGDMTVDEVINRSLRNLIKNRTRRHKQNNGYNAKPKEFEDVKHLFLSEMIGAIYNMEDDTKSKVRLTLHITKADETEETYSFQTTEFVKVED